MRSSPSRPLALVLTVLTGLLVVAIPQAVAAPVPECANRVLPPPPVDSSEVPPPGAASPTPLPVPETPVGGARMGECGLVVPDGADTPPANTATSWLLQDLETGTVLAAENPHGRYRPASLIKTLLALVVIRDLEPSRIVTATAEDASQECTCVGIVAGGRYKVEDLLDSLLMHSGNDVAHALGNALGGIPTALAKMNELAASLGATDTRAATTSGLDGPGMMTSAYDLSVIFNHAMRQPEFARAVSMEEMLFPGWGKKEPVQLYNDNKLLGTYEGFLGGKTGFTDDARHTYVGGTERDGTRIAVVMLRAEQRPTRVTEQAARLLDYGFELAAADVEPVGRIENHDSELTTTTTTTAAPEDEPAEAVVNAAGTGGAVDDGGTGTGPVLAVLIAVLGLLAALVVRRSHRA